ncbi:MAG: hypothetical protein M3Q51_01950 [Pseudomonadota bacterium]|nr:hypothetical protein [Pseudomonadota bacterium]
MDTELLLHPLDTAAATLLINLMLLAVVGALEPLEDACQSFRGDLGIDLAVLVPRG